MNRKNGGGKIIYTRTRFKQKRRTAVRRSISGG
jgi:hypothetical protein